MINFDVKFDIVWIGKCFVADVTLVVWFFGGLEREYNNNLHQQIASNVCLALNVNEKKTNPNPDL